ncbi:hypothetical protein, partial [Burkholderia pseudomallei]|uniref:hypothetical protein n=1 Tax=Burkholderia pseudomallei TaxID=28450 RepID=UPI001F2C915B
GLRLGAPSEKKKEIGEVRRYASNKLIASPVFDTADYVRVERVRFRTASRRFERALSRWRVWSRKMRR